MEAELMQALNRLLETIRLQLQGLTLNAKILIGSLMVILAMSLFLVSLYAGQRSMVPLNLPADFSPERKGQAVSFLKSRDIPYKEQGGEVLVPADQRTIVLAQLVDYQLLAVDQINFEKLMQDDSPFRSREQNQKRYNIAKMNELSAMIRQFQGINNAKVVIDVPVRGQGIGSSFIPPSATVTLTTNGRGLSPEKADTIAHLVASAHAGLRVEDVSVTDASTGELFQARGEDAKAAMKNLEAKVAMEEITREKILNQLSYIPGVRININAQVDTREVIQQMTNFENPKLGVTQETSRNRSSTRQSGPSEAGVRPNAGAVLAGGGAGQSMSDESSSTSSIPAFGNSNSHIRDSKGQALMINASIGVPRSYFVSIYLAQQDEGTDPPDAQTLEPIVQAEIASIRTNILPLIDTSATDGASAGVVEVAMFHDVASGGFGGSGLNGNGDSGASGASNLASLGLSEGLVKYVSLSGLALVSLLMMFFMVRRATTQEQMPSPEELVGIPPAVADSNSDLIGEAAETFPALEGLEIDEEHVRRQEMLEQISNMVKETPDEAAHLLRKWMSDGHQ
ncbi:MAG: hypothetical protein O7G85_11355 [Planctomycetota bacterium]|nr:hypothetical protein [Planctomycetota bacterium]